MERCKTCKWWDQSVAMRIERNYDGYAGAGGGDCTHPKLSTTYDDFDEEKRPNDALSYSRCEGGSFWTGPEFGCVHWEAKG